MAMGQAGLSGLRHRSGSIELMASAANYIARHPHTAQSFTGETPVPRMASWHGRPGHDTKLDRFVNFVSTKRL